MAAASPLRCTVLEVFKTNETILDLLHYLGGSTRNLAHALPTHPLANGACSRPLLCLPLHGTHSIAPQPVLCLTYRSKQYLSVIFSNYLAFFLVCVTLFQAHQENLHFCCFLLVSFLLLRLIFEPSPFSCKVSNTMKKHMSNTSNREGERK